ncbi:MAG: CBS domain-containing protein [Thaumarchaeota archaeon]|nr:CBS domain-containing protein [Nitrososphaerota archaeon]
MIKLRDSHHNQEEKSPKATSEIELEIFSEVFFGPGGTTISHVMKRDVITMDHLKTAHEAATLMAQKRAGCVIITAYERPFGIVTQRDLVRIMANLSISPKCLILSFLASRPLIYASPAQTIQEAAHIMEKNNIDHLPIVEKDKIVGIITTRDIAMSLLYA